MSIYNFYWTLVLSLISLTVLYHSGICQIITAQASERLDFRNKNDTYRRIWSVEKKVALLCVMECSRDIECVSVLYNTVTQVCQAHSVTLGNPSVAFEDPDTRYYVLSFGEHYIGDSCITSTDCWTINTECREGLCQCIPGYSFSPKTHECKVCDLYDDSNFMGVANQYMAHSNMEEFSPVTLEECRQLCLSRTTYLCLTFEFWYSDTCALQAVTKLHRPDKWRIDTVMQYGITHYQRDCA